MGKAAKPGNDIPVTNGKIKVESKQDMRKRGVESPNLSDALYITSDTFPAAEEEDYSNIYIPPAYSAFK